MSITNRLQLWLMCVVIVALALAGVVCYQLMHSAVRLYTYSKLVSEAGGLALMTAQTEEGPVLEVRPEKLQYGYEVGDSTYFVVLAPDGREIGRSRSLGDDAMPPGQFGPNDLDMAVTEFSDGRPAMLVRLRWDPRRIGSGSPLTGEASNLGYMTIIVACDSRTDGGIVARASLALLVMAAVLLVVAFVVIRVTLLVGLAPLRRLNRDIHKIDVDAPAGTIDPAGVPRELVATVHAVNQLRDRLGGAIERERCFAANAAHELRTPLAEIRAIAEVEQMGPTSEALSDVAFGSIVEIAARAGRTTDALLAVAKGQRPAERDLELVDLAAHVELAAQRHHARAMQRGVVVERAQVSHPPRRMWRFAVDAILENLIRNAVAYTLPGGRVEIRVQETGGGGTEFTVRNGPTELTAADASRVFELFWRASHAAKEEGRSGVGLSVVQTLCRTVGGSVRCSVDEERRVTVRAELPPLVGEGGKG